MGTRAQNSSSPLIASTHFNRFMKRILPLMAAVACWVSCETEDVTGIGSGNALASIRADRLAIGENADSVRIIVDLDIPAEANVVVSLSFEGTATYGVDYGSDNSQVNIAAGDQSGFVTLFSFEDTDVEATELIIVRITSMSGARLGNPSSVSVNLEDNDGATSSFGLILNEILYDPSNNGLDGDANGDGAYVHREDEFLEFVNISSQSFDMSGYKVYDEDGWLSNSPKHEFPIGTIVPSGKALVLFGGGTPTGSFGGAVVQTSTSGDMNLNNGGDRMRLTNAADSVLIEFDIEPLSDNPNESYTRNPDITGDFEQHSDNSALLFSPGTRRDLSPF